ncbi:MAG: glycosyltransferase family 39 protein [Chloroflexi bacterium]|nr:glycosyltransferase family 39 protein [Chloroflexota bacterium]
MKTVARFLWFLVGLGLAMYVAFAVWFAFVGLAYPYQLDYGEGIVLWFAQEIARGHSIYKSLDAFPYASSNYPPVAMALAAALMPILGDGYAGGRLLNVASAVIVAALIFRIVRVETRDARAASLAACFFLGAPYIFHWISLFRVDLIGLAFAFAGVYFAWRFDRKTKLLFTDYCLLISCFLLALYTKQSLVAAPVAAFLALFLRDKRAAIAFAIALGASGIAIYLAMDVATRGGFTAGLIDSNATVFLPEQLGELLKNFAFKFPVLILLAAWSWIARVRARQWGVLEWYALVAFGALALSGRVGAWENYFFEAIVIACVFGGLLMADSGLNHLPSAIRHLPFAIRYPLFAILLLIQLALFWHDPRIAADLIARDLPANRELATLLARTNGTIISEDMGALATSGKPVAYYTFQYSSLARAGKWNQHFELDGLRAGAFPFVILENGTREDVDYFRRFTREFVSALDRYYGLTQTIGKYRIYTPAPPLRLQSENFGDAISLVGWSAQPEMLQPGNFKLTLVWQAQHSIPQQLTAFAHLERADGNKVTQDDHAPMNGVYPTTRWSANEMVRDTFALNVPNDLPPGKYVLRIGWYDTDTGDRLAVPGSADDAFELTTFEVK